MKTLKQILLTFTAVIGLSIAISAQKNDDQKKPPPKDPPPVVNPKEKPPPRNPPHDDKKKPGMAFLLVLPKENSDSA